MPGQYDYDAIIVGAGIGGVGVGALLAHAGYRVLLVEKNTLIGGRCTTYERDGFSVDVGVHLFGLGEKGPLGEILRRVDRSHAVEWVLAKDPKPLLYYDGTLQVYSRQTMMNMLPPETVADMAAMFQAIFTLGEEDLQALWHVSLAEWIATFSRHPLVHLFMEGICGQYFCVPSHEASAAEFITSFREVVTARSSAYPKGGCIAIPRAYARCIEDHRGHILLGVPVEKVLVEKGKAAGVLLRDGRLYRGRRVICNADIKHAVDVLVGPEHFPRDYVETIRGLTYAMHALGLKVALDEKVTPQKFIMYMPWSFEKVQEIRERILMGEIPERTGGMITSPSNFDPSLAPKGKQLIFFGTACLPHQDWELWGRRCMDALLEVLPGVRGHVLWYRLDTPDDIQRYAGEEGNVIGVGQTVTQIAERRPKVKTPLEGFYLASAEAGGHGIGAELAASSAIELFETILDEDARAVRP